MFNQLFRLNIVELTFMLFKIFFSFLEGSSCWAITRCNLWLYTIPLPFTYNIENPSCHLVYSLILFIVIFIILKANYSDSVLIDSFSFQSLIFHGAVKALRPRTPFRRHLILTVPSCSSWTILRIWITALLNLMLIFHLSFVNSKA